MIRQELYEYFNRILECINSNYLRINHINYQIDENKIVFIDLQLSVVIYIFRNN